MRARKTRKKCKIRKARKKMKARRTYQIRHVGKQGTKARKKRNLAQS